MRMLLTIPLKPATGAESTNPDTNGELSVLIATAIDLWLRFKHVYWIVQGSSLQEVKGYLDDMGEEVEDVADLLADRITQLEGTAGGNLQEVLALTPYPSYPKDMADLTQHLLLVIDSTKILLIKMKALIAATQLPDPVTADILTEACRGLEQRLFYLISFTSNQGKEGPAPVVSLGD